MPKGEAIKRFAPKAPKMWGAIKNVPKRRGPLKISVPKPPNSDTPPFPSNVLSNCLAKTSSDFAFFFLFFFLEKASCKKVNKENSKIYKIYLFIYYIQNIQKKYT